MPGQLRSAVERASLLARSARWPVRSLTAPKLVSSLLHLGVAPDVVLDVGANKGQFTVSTLELAPNARVIAFEPSPEQADALRSLIPHYGERLTVRQAAVGSIAERRTLNLNRFHQSSSLLDVGERHREAFPDAVPVGAVEVDVVTLDGEVAALGDSVRGRRVLLKIDVQGFELEVLRGAAGVLPTFEWVVLEVSFSSLYDGAAGFHELYSHMTDAGFSLQGPVGHLCDPATGEYLQMDLLFRRAGVDHC